MEIIIYSGSAERGILFGRIIDGIIMRRRLRLMSLHTVFPRNAEELKSLIRPDRGYLVIADADGFPDWKKTAAEISSECRRVSFCIVSESAENAAEAINTEANVCGYIKIAGNRLEESFEKVLENIYGRITTVCGGIMTFGEDGSLKIISFSDIYYIETIKQQHRCTIYHKNGTDTMRADISRLIEQLDGRFEITRSSTIANLSAVCRIEDGLIFFGDGIFCSAAAKRLGEIKKIMRTQTVVPPGGG
ncbi:MAG: LytTR family transcriptional regulator DNA-binding domain-containing protein [Prevotella sp.]|nr:LytTR family transcriptional regulator DNA-binding domain-containing protein [Prevotella sp.]